MRAGDLRHKITIQTRTEVSDGMGGYTETWADTYGAWAAVWPIRGPERLNYMQLESQISHRIRIRYRNGITRKHRIIFHDVDGNRTFNIKEIINPDERNISLELLCTEEVE